MGPPKNHSAKNINYKKERNKTKKQQQQQLSEKGLKLTLKNQKKKIIKFVYFFNSNYLK